MMTVAHDFSAPLTLGDIPMWRMSVESYLARVERGLFLPEDRLELLAGMVVEKMTNNGRHNAAQLSLNRLFHRLVPDGWLVGIETSIVTGDSVPEPDVVLLRGEPSDFIDHPAAADRIGLVVEVADSTLRSDRRLKGEVYARAGIAVYWIVNLNDRLIEVYTQPISNDDAPGYAAATAYSKADSVPFALDGVKIARVSVAEIMP